MYVVEVILTLQSPLHIGALSPSGTSAIRGLVKDRDGWPYIPASTFKGRLRHTIERLGRGLNYSVCETHRKMCRERSTACPVCKLFGSAWIPGTVRFVDLQLSQPVELVEQRQARQPANTVDRFGVAISRSRKVASDRLLYTTELFQPGVPLAFRGAISDVPDISAAAWIVAGVNWLDSLGSDRSRGLGWLKGETIVNDESGNLISSEVLRQQLER